MLSTIRSSLFLAFLLLALSLYAQNVPTGFADDLVQYGFNDPVGITFDENNHMYVWEKGGRVMLVENGVTLQAPLLDLTEEVGNWGDHGLLGFVLDPDYANNGYMYLMYVVDRYHLFNAHLAGYNSVLSDYNSATIIRITRYTLDPNTLHSVIPSSRKVLLGESPSTGVPVLFQSHSAGSLVFGDDGTLIASVGDGAGFLVVDAGGLAGTYYAQALIDGIITPEENVGAFRSQMLTSLSGKIIRMDPATGDGVPSNPYYDAAAPRSPRSRTWALGLRNPFRMSIRTGSGSSDPNDGDPGTLLIGDVGWSAWEEVDVCDGPGQNFGWPLFEGMGIMYSYENAITDNLNYPHPLYNVGGCTQQYYTFQDLLIQETLLHNDLFPEPCNSNLQIPAYVPTHVHKRPAVDWKHTGTTQARVPAFQGTTAAIFNLGDQNCPVAGASFSGNAAAGGIWFSGADFPPGYQGVGFHFDYAEGWIKKFEYNALDELVSVEDFADNLGLISFATEGPEGCLYYIRFSDKEIRRICYTQNINLPPVVVASQDVVYGPGPLTVSFTGSNSSDPESGTLTYLWDFDDGSTSALEDPTYTFAGNGGNPFSYHVTCTVTDDQGQARTQQLLVSVDNTPPSANITSFPDGQLYPVGIDTLFLLNAAASDQESPIQTLSFEWRTILYHNSHNHPEPVDYNQITATSIFGVGCVFDPYHYEVELIVTDPQGLSTKTVHALYADCSASPPAALIDASTVFGVAPLTVILDGTASFDNDAIISYEWVLDDGNFHSGDYLQHTFVDPGLYEVTLTVMDVDGTVDIETRSIQVIGFDPPQCVGPLGQIEWEFWDNVGGWLIGDLLSHPSYPLDPDSVVLISEYKTPINIGDNFGARMRGYLVPPSDGWYTFGITADDHALLRLSLNADDANIQDMAHIEGYTGQTELDKYAEQVSDPVFLQAGVYYYTEAIHKEFLGGDHLIVYWKTPQDPTWNVVPGSVMASWEDCPPTIQVELSLQAVYDQSTGLMRSDLTRLTDFPLVEPYTDLGFEMAGGGGESIGVIDATLSPGYEIVDWVLVELRSGADPSQIHATQAALLRRNGQVVDVNGYRDLTFNVAADNYFVAVRHRNHLGTMIAKQTYLGNRVKKFDFTSYTLDTYGVSARKLKPNGNMMLWLGNSSLDDRVMYTGGGNDRDVILQAIGGNIPTKVIQGYHEADINMNGEVKYGGAGNDRDPILVNIGGSLVTKVIYEQLP